MAVVVPFVVLTLGDPRLLLPSLNCTVPVGVPLPGAVTLMVAVKVTNCPENEGLGEEVTAVLVGASLTTCLKLGEVLVVKLVSPL